MIYIIHEITILKAFGILLVVGGHVGGFLNWIGIPWSNNAEIFPAYSFHMPLFFFASGYFYNSKYDSQIYTLLRKRISSLVIPYYKWNLFYGLLVTFLIINLNFSKGNILSISNFLFEPWISGYQYNLNGPAWFVLCLFLSQILYVLSRKLFFATLNYLSLDIKVNFDYLLLIIYILLGLLCTYLSINYNILNNVYIYILIRTTFSIQFLHFGYCYKNYIKTYITFNIYTFLILISTKICFIEIAKNYTFSMRTLIFRDEVFMPIITSFLGILYILHLVAFIKTLLDKYPSASLEKHISFLGDNTWSIMMHHMLFNYILLSLYDFISLEIFDYMNFIFMTFVLPIGCTYLPILFDKSISKISTSMISKIPK